MKHVRNRFQIISLQNQKLQKSFGANYSASWSAVGDIRSGTCLLALVNHHHRKTRFKLVGVWFLPATANVRAKLHPSHLVASAPLGSPRTSSSTKARLRESVDCPDPRFEVGLCRSFAGARACRLPTQDIAGVLRINLRINLRQ